MILGVFGFTVVVTGGGAGRGSRSEGHRGKLARNRTRNLGGSPMILDDKVHGFRLHALRRAKELGNVSAACR